MTDQHAARVAKALGHPARLRIVRLLAEQNECRGHDVFGELPLAQSTISQHLRVLKDAGVIRSHAIGTSMVYCLESSVVREFSQLMESLAAEAATRGPGQGDAR